MLYETMRHIRNFFPDKGRDGRFKIENGTIDLTGLVQNNQYMLIEGSVFNDGVHKYNSDLVLINEEFEGRITALKIPKKFLELVEEMASFESSRTNSPYVSESFGGYSYTKATGSGGGEISAFEQFKTRLNAWRKI